MFLDKFLVCYRKINESVIADNNMDLCFTFSQKCCLCTGKSKTFSAIQKHAERKHTVEGDRALDVVFLDNEENEASVTDIGFLNRRSQDFKIGYLTWLAGLREQIYACLLYTSPSPRDATLSRMPSSA